MVNTFSRLMKWHYTSVGHSLHLTVIHIYIYFLLLSTTRSPIYIFAGGNFYP
uniref:Uncharacterized protein n=1 Tax=Octopus bimaculoides TaxID=37653 RepID=A0A0L8G7T7_OCTBM